MDKVLVVDGYPSVRELLAEELASEGKMVVAIGNPDLIGELVETFGPDLIILDLYINGKKRWNLLKEIKKRSPQLPILIYTGDYPKGDARLSLADGWVVKSCLLDELRQKMTELLKRKTSGGNTAGLSPIRSNPADLPRQGSAPVRHG
jgi:DNA-binding response OmpR family regulator